MSIFYVELTKQTVWRYKMSKDEYERGKDAGRDGDFIDDAVQGNTKSSSSSDYNKGYTDGQEDRWSGSSGDSDSSSSSSGGCYLTTACVNAMGFSDNCFELTVLRNYRDSILLKTPHGKKAIREYYIIAPQIVSAINALGINAKSIWAGTYVEISKAVSLVLSKDFDKAYSHYKNMTQNLMRRYL
jgi:hypothetical protein